MWQSVKSVLPIGILVTAWYTAVAYNTKRAMEVPPSDSVRSK